MQKYQSLTTDYIPRRPARQDETQAARGPLESKPPIPNPSQGPRLQNLCRYATQTKLSARKSNIFETHEAIYTETRAAACSRGCKI